MNRSLAAYPRPSFGASCRTVEFGRVFDLTGRLSHLAYFYGGRIVLGLGPDVRLAYLALYGDLAADDPLLLPGRTSADVAAPLLWRYRMQVLGNALGEVVGVHVRASIPRLAEPKVLRFAAPRVARLAA